MPPVGFITIASGAVLSDAIAGLDKYALVALRFPANMTSGHLMYQAAFGPTAPVSADYGRVQLPAPASGVAFNTLPGSAGPHVCFPPLGFPRAASVRLEVTNAQIDTRTITYLTR